jgi:hypothetical protein
LLLPAANAPAPAAAAFAFFFGAGAAVVAALAKPHNLLAARVLGFTRQWISNLSLSSYQQLFHKGREGAAMHLRLLRMLLLQRLQRAEGGRALPLPWCVVRPAAPRVSLCHNYDGLQSNDITWQHQGWRQDKQLRNPVRGGARESGGRTRACCECSCGSSGR